MLQRGEVLRRRFREETVTDILMNYLLAIGGGSIIVEFPDEPSTGADMEWNFVNRDTKEHFQILLQAKRISESGSDWSQHRYKGLFYRSGSPKTLQVETLCKTAKARSPIAFPAYIFYNLAKTCQFAHAAGSTSLQGVNLCDARIIELLAQSSASKTLEKKNSAVGVVYPFLFALTDIFCPSNIQPLGPLAFSRGSIPLLLSLGRNGPSLGRPMPPRPDQVYSRLEQWRTTTLEQLRAVDRQIDLPLIPEVSRNAPEELQTLINRIEGPERAYLSPIDFWRVTFVSENPRDDVGELAERTTYR